MRYITQESVEVTENVDQTYTVEITPRKTRNWTARVSGHTWDQSRVDHRVRSAWVEMEREGATFEEAMTNLKEALAAQGIELR